MTATTHKTLLESFQRWEKTTPDAVYMTQPWPDGRVTDYTWGQVGDQARRMAAQLVSLKLPRGSNIALLGRNSAHWIMADLAIWMAGHVTVPLYATLNAEGTRYILAHCEAKLLLLGKMDGIADGWNDIRQGIPESLPTIALPMAPRKAPLENVPQWDDIVARTAPLKEIAAREPDEVATIVYTSGSTGQPKGVVHSFRSMLAFPEAYRRAIDAGYVPDIGPEDRLISHLPLAHVAERAVIECASFHTGFRIYFAHSLETFAEDLRRARPTLFGTVPRLWTKFYMGVEQKLPLKKQLFLFRIPLVGRLVRRKILRAMGLDQARSLGAGAAPLPPTIIEWARALFGLDILEFYGMSENFAVSHRGHQNHFRLGYVGMSYPGVECRIADNGEILVKSPGQMLGYYKQPELIAECMTPDGYFRTGDRGELDEMGRLKITGRVKELFKTSKGKYVAPAPIENKLAAHPKVEAVCVTGPSQPQPFALLMLSLDARNALAAGTLKREALGPELDALLKDVNTSLEDHEKLAYLVVVKDLWNIENGFLTPTLKIKRGVIEDRYLAQADQWLARTQAVIWE